jgi:hypothetical protein
MNHSSVFHIGYVNGASRWTRNLTLVAWAIYTPMHTLLQSSGICLGPATNNQAEYVVVIGLLVDVVHLHIRHLNVFLWILTRHPAVKQCISCT